VAPSLFGALGAWEVAPPLLSALVAFGVAPPPLFGSLGAAGVAPSPPFDALGAFGVELVVGALAALVALPPLFDAFPGVEPGAAVLMGLETMVAVKVLPEEPVEVLPEEPVEVLPGVPAGVGARVCAEAVARKKAIARNWKRMMTVKVLVAE
jgi:hypothetical protein